MFKFMGYICTAHACIDSALHVSRHCTHDPGQAPIGHNQHLIKPFAKTRVLTFQGRDEKMLKWCVIACVLALAAAQTPTRPVFSETFYASGEVELHVAEETRFGKCDCTLFTRYLKARIINFYYRIINDNYYR